MLIKTTSVITEDWKYLVLHPECDITGALLPTCKDGTKDETKNGDTELTGGHCLRISGPYKQVVVRKFPGKLRHF